MERWKKKCDPRNIGWIIDYLAGTRGANRNTRVKISNRARKSKSSMGTKNKIIRKRYKAFENS